MPCLKISGGFSFWRCVIGHGNSTKVDTTKDYQQSLTAMKEKTPGEKLWEEQSAKTLAWAARGDYRNPHEGGIFVNYADPAMLHEHRALEQNAGAEGVYALGTPDPNYLATVKEQTANENERSDAAQYESDIRQGVGAAGAAAGSAEGLDISRKGAVLGTTADLFKQQQAKPKWWNYFLGAAAQVGTGFATGGLSTMMAKPAPAGG